MLRVACSSPPNRGLITVDTGTWYLVNGEVDYTYNGDIDAKGVIYTVVNGYATAY